MTDTRLYLAIGVPVVVNATILGIVATLLLNHINSHGTALRGDIASIRADIRDLTSKVVELDVRLDRLERR